MTTRLQYNQVASNPDICNGRLTLTSGTPVTTASVTSGSVLYFSPYKGNLISLYDGAKWNTYSFAEIPLVLTGYTDAKPYDIWACLSGSAVILESTVWTNGTTRATGITLVDGIYTKTGDATRRYLGTIYMSGTGLCDDSVTKRYVWNYYNRVGRLLTKSSTSSHYYSDAVQRYWNNDSTLAAYFVIGVAEDLILVLDNAVISSGGNGTLVGVGYDNMNVMANMLFTSGVQRGGSSYLFSSVIGYHYFSIVEYGGQAGQFEEAYMEEVIQG